MAAKNYLDFDLQIGKAPDGYTVRVQDSQQASASCAFRAPFSDVELENFLLRIGRPRTITRRAQTPETEAAKKFGGALYSSLFQTDVFGLWSASLNEAARRNMCLRVRLHLNDAPEL